MKSAFGLIAVVCLLVLVVGCRRTSRVVSPAPPTPTARAAPSPPVSRSAATTTPDAEEQEALRRGAADVAQSFLDVLQAENWAKAIEFFCADFRKAHRQELLDGSLLQKGRGKQSSVSVFFAGQAGEYATMRGERAWVGVSASSGGRHSKIGLATLELVREDGEWKVLRYPPSYDVSYARRAGYDGEAAGRWFRGMLSDGEFTEEEQAEIAQVLDRYYAVVVQMESQAEGRPLPPPMYRPATMEWLTKRATHLEEARPGFKLASIAFWPEPDEDITTVAQALAEQAIRQVHKDLAAIKDEYPELADFGQENVNFSDTSLFYAPNPSEPGQKGSVPTISVSIGTPYLGVTQATFPQRIFLPRQKLAVGRHAWVTDEQLAKCVKETIEKNVVPLIRFEKILGGEPVYDNW